MKKLLFTPLLLALVACHAPRREASFEVVPLPQEINYAQAAPFVLHEQTTVYYPQGDTLLGQNAGFLSEYIRQATGYAPVVKAETPSTQKDAPAICLKLDAGITDAEGYRLTVDANQIVLTGSTAQGVFYGVQTLRKAIPPVAEGAEILFPAVTITDAPRFGYRGMHLDVARHFFSVDFVKRYIDLLALHHMNTFHWHLTDDQGWRIEIKKYPRLTEVGSVRQQTMIGHNRDSLDHTPYGGYYTQAELKEVVRYAAERYITVIPEVDLPGHMLAALAAYPELGCTGGPYEVSPRWGIFEDVLCVGNEHTMQFLEDVMEELIDIFPSPYIHIGGDESPRTRWKVCPKCQARIRVEGLKADRHHTAEDRLQSYCMRRIEAFLNERGRRIIGWDEILDGDVAPNATVMSWRGMEGGKQAATLGHDVVMVPTSHCYFDYYQTKEIADEPFVGIGGYVPIEKVYSLEPVPPSLTPRQQQHILGAQANLWTEFISTPQEVEYSVLPRMAALAEVQWTQPARKEYTSFVPRLVRMMEFYRHDGRTYSKHLLDLNADFVPDAAKRAVVVTLGSADDAPIYYTLEGSAPTARSTRYTAPFPISRSADLRAVAIRPQGESKEIRKQISFNKATFRPLELLTKPSAKYTFQGAVTLVDGMNGGASYAAGDWLGIVGSDVEMIIDLEQSTGVSRVATHALVDLGAWIMGSTGLVVLASDDRQVFRPVGERAYPAETNISKQGIETYEVSFPPVQTRYLKVIIRRTPELPKGHPGEGRAPFIFIDEVIVE